MQMNKIEEYIQTLLIPQLEKYKLHKYAINKIAADIESRLFSIISNWSNVEFRDTLLFLGAEEARFYEPYDVELNIKSLAVMAVRNSLLENAKSTVSAAKSLGLKKPMIQDKDVPYITGSAIRFFNNIDLSLLAANLKSKDKNLFDELPIKYRVAWTALFKLSQLKDDTREMHYEPIESPKMELSELRHLKVGNIKTNYSRADIQSGMDMAISDSLWQRLHFIKHNKDVPFLLDSFKHLTRNPEKFFLILEFILRSGSAFITKNVFIKNGYVGKRKTFIRPSHNNDDIKDLFKQIDELILELKAEKVS